jgi:hypothetical protein
VSELFTKIIDDKKIFWMKDVEVDGIKGVHPGIGDTFIGKMFTLKDEFTDKGEVNDTGQPFKWVAEEISEKHWLEMGHITVIGRFCCGRIIEE